MSNHVISSKIHVYRTSLLQLLKVIQETKQTNGYYCVSISFDAVGWAAGRASGL